MCFLKKILKKKKQKPRTKPDDDICPFCGLQIPIIYDQNHDACTTCNSKWEITPKH